MIDARFRPLGKWAREPRLGYERAQFKTPYPRTLDKLEYELSRLAATDIIIEAGFAREDLRNDGWPFGGRKPSHPGVVLYFKGTDGALEFPCGTYDSFGSNLHAIALTLENLRAIDRYGVTLGHQQYRGFLALEAAPKTWTVEQAAKFIESASSFSAVVVRESAHSYRLAYRQAAGRLHPDVAKSNDGWYNLAQARAILDAHHDLKTVTGPSAS